MAVEQGVGVYVYRPLGGQNTFPGKALCPEYPGSVDIYSGIPWVDCLHFIQACMCLVEFGQHYAFEPGQYRHSLDEHGVYLQSLLGGLHAQHQALAGVQITADNLVHSRIGQSRACRGKPGINSGGFFK